MELLKQLYTIHSPFYREWPMICFIHEYIRQHVPEADVQMDSWGNLYVVKGEGLKVKDNELKGYPTLVCHLDQVQELHSDDFCVKEEDGTLYGWSEKNQQREGLGADDKNGIWVCLRCLEECQHLKVFIGITSIVIPKSVREISWHSSFFGCRNLTSIVVEEGNEFYDSRENCNAIIETEKNALIAGCKTSVIPSSVTKIMSKAFSEVGLSSFVVPDNIVSISTEAFSKNDELQTITIGSSIKSFGGDVFKKCDNLKRVILKVTDPSQIQIDRGVELGGYQATLCVPDEKGVLAAYKKKAIWKKFAAIETFVAETGQNEENDEWASFLELIGMKDSKLKLKPISPEYDIKDMLTVTYHVTEDMLPFTAVLDDAKAVQMYVDDQVAKPFKKKVTFKKAGESSYMMKVRT